MAEIDTKRLRGLLAGLHGAWELRSADGAWDILIGPGEWLRTDDTEAAAAFAVEAVNALPALLDEVERLTSLCATWAADHRKEVVALEIVGNDRDALRDENAALKARVAELEAQWTAEANDASRVVSEMREECDAARAQLAEVTRERDEALRATADWRQRM